MYKTAIVGYKSNNSGGHWWLSDADWRALEEAGWKVNWVKDSPSIKRYGGLDSDGRWIGALATSASRTGLPKKMAVAEFEMVTGQFAADKGCPCCGEPHAFYYSKFEDDEYEIDWDLEDGDW